MAQASSSAETQSDVSETQCGSGIAATRAEMLASILAVKEHIAAGGMKADPGTLSQQLQQTENQAAMEGLFDAMESKTTENDDSIKRDRQKILRMAREAEPVRRVVQAAASGGAAPTKAGLQLLSKRAKKLNKKMMEANRIISEPVMTPQMDIVLRFLMSPRLQLHLAELCVAAGIKGDEAGEILTGGSKKAQESWLKATERMGELTNALLAVVTTDKLRELVVAWRVSLQSFTDLDPEGNACEQPVRRITQLLDICLNMIKE